MASGILPSRSAAYACVMRAAARAAATAGGKNVCAGGVTFCRKPDVGRGVRTDVGGGVRTVVGDNACMVRVLGRSLCTQSWRSRQ